jgi:hypothetical protein
MAAHAGKSSVWMDFRTLLPLPTPQQQKDLLLAGNMPAVHLKNKSLLFSVIHEPSIFKDAF